jgi:dTDP-4-dehydrorhamnose 3,5-epimerase
MIFRPTGLDGAFLVDLERHRDARGWFARAWDATAFEERGLNPRVVQCNLSYNRRAGTLRGLHYQAEPHAEAKLIRCTAGAIFDVIVDLRPTSPSHGRWFGVELTSASGRMLYVPQGFAHGYQTLVDDTETFYQVSEFYAPEAERGVRWDDPAIAIQWPIPEPSEVSDKDASWPDLHL